MHKTFRHYDLIWLSPPQAREIAEGTTVLVQRQRGPHHVYEVKHWFRPDWVTESGYITDQPAKFHILPK